MAMELLDKANENLTKKCGTEEHSSLLPEMQYMISQMYPNVAEYNYIFGEFVKKLLPDLEEYNVSYDTEKFKVLERDFSQKMMKTSQNGIVVTR